MSSGKRRRIAGAGRDTAAARTAGPHNVRGVRAANARAAATVAASAARVGNANITLSRTLLKGKTGDQTTHRSHSNWRSSTPSAKTPATVAHLAAAATGGASHLSGARAPTALAVSLATGAAITATTAVAEVAAAYWDVWDDTWDYGDVEIDDNDCVTVPTMAKVGVAHAVADKTDDADLDGEGDEESVSDEL
jgi:hypothetical protein